MSRSSGLRASVAVAVAVVALDQLTKAWALDALATRTIHVVWTLRLNLVRNSGMAFGQGEGWGPLLASAGLLAVVGLLLSLRRGASGPVGVVAVGLVVGGAVGNLADRLFRAGDEGFLHGAVVDFVDLQWWPVFNVADAAITVGALLLVFSVLGGPRPAPPAPGPPGSEAPAVEPDGTDEPADRT